MDNINPIKKKLLIVEDDFYIRDLYEIEAKKHGFEVTLDKYEQSYKDARIQKIRVPLKKMVMAAQKIVLNSLVIFIVFLILAGVSSAREIYHNRGEIRELYAATKTKTKDLTQKSKNFAQKIKTAL